MTDLITPSIDLAPTLAPQQARVGAVPSDAKEASEQVLAALDAVRAQLGGLRDQRKGINAQIRVLVAQASLLERMARSAEEVLRIEAEGMTEGDDDDDRDDPEGAGSA